VQSTIRLPSQNPKFPAINPKTQEIPLSSPLVTSPNPISHRNQHKNKPLHQIRFLKKVGVSVPPSSVELKKQQNKEELAAKLHRLQKKSSSLLSGGSESLQAAEKILVSVFGGSAGLQPCEKVRKCKGL
jgi:hypothetical protein